jgi:hypothetical protein
MWFICSALDLRINVGWVNHPKSCSNQLDSLQEGTALILLRRVNLFSEGLLLPASCCCIFLKSMAAFILYTTFKNWLKKFERLRLSFGKYLFCLLTVYTHIADFNQPSAWFLNLVNHPLNGKLSFHKRMFTVQGPSKCQKPFAESEVKEPVLSFSMI